MLRLKFLIWLMNVQLNKTIKHRDSLESSGDSSQQPFIKSYDNAIRNYKTTILFLNSQKRK